MRKKLEFTREKIGPHTERVKVIGGWIVVVENVKHSALTSQFIADRNHEWEIINPYEEESK